jgi:hypothetical protein
MLARPLETCGKAQQFVLAQTANRDQGDDLRPPPGQGSGLVHDERVDALQPL